MKLLCLSTRKNGCKKYFENYERVFTIYDVDITSVAQLMKFIENNMPIEVCIDNIHGREALILKTNGINYFKC